MNTTNCDKVAQIARLLYERQMVNTNEGNVSIRDGNKIYITPSQTCKGILTPDMIVITDLDGNQIGGHLKASSEILLHLHIYRLREDVKSVIHTHSPFATAFAIAGKPIESRSYTEMIYFYDKIPVVDYGAPGTEKIIAGIHKYIYQTDTFLLSNHGLVSVGSDIDDAYRKSEAVESIAKTLAITHLIGGEKALSDSELDEIYELRKLKLGKNKII